MCESELIYALKVAIKLQLNRKPDCWAAIVHENPACSAEAPRAARRAAGPVRPPAACKGSNYHRDFPNEVNAIASLPEKHQLANEETFGAFTAEAAKCNKANLCASGALRERGCLSHKTERYKLESSSIKQSLL